MIPLIGFIVIAQLAALAPGAYAEDGAQLSAPGRESSRIPLIDSERWVGVVGDSGVTGAASSPEISANVFALLKEFSGIVWPIPPEPYRPPGVAPLTRIYGAPSETDQSGERTSRALDVPVHGFGYLVSRAIGVSPADVVLVGQDGKGVSNIPRQLKRLFEMDTETLPPLVFTSFTANDFCDLKALTQPVPERAAAFRATLERAWEQSRPWLKAHPRGTEFVVLAPLEVANVLTNPDLLAQVIPLGMYGTVTCSQLRRGDLDGSPLARSLANGLVNMCPLVLGTHPDDAPRVARLREIQDAFNLVWKETIANLNKAHRGEGLSWTYVEEVRDLKFTTGDVANDCFHPSAAGHAKIAALLLKRGSVARP